MSLSAAASRWPSDKPIPATCTDSILMQIVGLTHTPFYRRKARGEYAFLELRPQPPGNTVYSGLLITRWLAGEWDASRYFAHARKALVRHGKPGRPRKSMLREAV